MATAGFEQALASRVDDMLDACTKCGACFEACPIAEPAGLGQADPKAIVSGVLDILRLGKGPADSEKWAKACMASGECIKACDYGVNPRFLLTMARLAMLRNDKDATERRKQGVAVFRKLGEDIGVLSRLQLSEESLIRLGQKPSKAPPRTELPDVVFYTGCNVLKTPHIALLCLDIMDKVGIDYQVMGGPTHCCGTTQLRQGDVDTLGRFANNTIDKLAQSKSKTVLAWCPSCMMQFGETVLPTYEKVTGEKPFDFLPFMPYLHDHLDELRPYLTNRVAMKVALHKHPGIAGVMEAAEALLRAVPGIEIVTLDVPAVGLQSVNLATLPKFKAELQLRELEAARAAGVDALVAVYHSDHRELCAHERDWPFRIMNILEIVGESMGFSQDDHYKDLKIKQDVDAIISDSTDLLRRHGVDLDTARRVIVSGMLKDQPLPLQGKQAAAR
jgi:heterodisulfide reductase subunit D